MLTKIFGKCAVLAYLIFAFTSGAVAQTTTQQPDPMSLAAETIARAETLINTVVSIGSVAIGVLLALLAAVLVVGGVVGKWHFQHRHLAERLQTWESVLGKSKNEAVSITQKLALPPLVDMKLDHQKAMMQTWIDRTEKSKAVEEIDRITQLLTILVYLDAEVFLNLGHYYRHKGHESEDAGDQPSAAKLFETGFRRYRDAAKMACSKGQMELEAAAHQSMAVCLERLSRFSESFINAEKAATILEHAGEPHYLPYDSKGIALHVLGKYEEAVSAFQSAVGLTDDPLRTRYNLACAHAKAGDVSDATNKAQHYEQALSHFSEIAGNNVTRDRARTDADFDSLGKDATYGERFKQLLS